MAIEKGIYSAPQGVADKEMGEEVESELEIEIVDPEAVTLSDGYMEITLIPDAEISDFTSVGWSKQTSTDVKSGQTRSLRVWTYWASSMKNVRSRGRGPVGSILQCSRRLLSASKQKLCPKRSLLRGL